MEKPVPIDKAFIRALNGNGVEDLSLIGTFKVRIITGQLAILTPPHGMNYLIFGEYKMPDGTSRFEGRLVGRWDQFRRLTAFEPLWNVTLGNITLSCMWFTTKFYVGRIVDYIVIIQFKTPDFDFLVASDDSYQIDLDSIPFLWQGISIDDLWKYRTKKVSFR